MNIPKIQKSPEGIVNKEKVEQEEVRSTFDKREVATQNEPINLSMSRKNEPLDLSMSLKTVITHTIDYGKEQESNTRELKDRNVGMIFNQQTSQSVSIKKKHKCTFCDYSSFGKSDVTSHIRTHTGERPYECKLCYYSSARKSDLTRHYSRIHNLG